MRRQLSQQELPKNPQRDSSNDCSFYCESGSLVCELVGNAGVRQALTQGVFV
jgi:hypothetical protein